MKGTTEPAALVLGRFISGLSSRELPPAVTDKAKQCLLDTLGCIIGGSRAPSGVSCATAVRGLGGPEESQVYGYPFRAPVANAALANGTMAHSLELDDSLFGHTGGPVVSAALAMAERCRSDGSELLAAIVAGYEVFSRIGRIVNRMFAHEGGFHPTGICAPFGAAAVAASLLKLTPEQTASAFGIAGSQAAGLMEYISDGSWTKRLHPGWGAHAGIMAAYLSAAGFSGPWTVLEGESGFFRAYLREEVSGERIHGELGERYQILDNCFKVFSCCRQIHSSLTAIQEIGRRRPLVAEEIAEIRCTILQDGYHLTAEPREGLYRPRGVVDAQFSLPYSVAALVVRGSALLDSFTEETIRDPALLSLAERVKVTPNPEFDRLKVEEGQYPAEVTVVFRDGSEEFERVQALRGHPLNPIGQRDLEEKFAVVAGAVLSPETVRRVNSLVMEVEGLPDAAGRLADAVTEGLPGV